MYKHHTYAILVQHPLQLNVFFEYMGGAEAAHKPNQSPGRVDHSSTLIYSTIYLETNLFGNMFVEVMLSMHVCD